MYNAQSWKNKSMRKDQLPKNEQRLLPKYPSEKTDGHKKSLQATPKPGKLHILPKDGKVARPYSVVNLHDMKNIKTKQLKHHEIITYLSEEIAKGGFQPGQRIPTEHELAKAFNASRPTIGKALRDLQKQGLIYRKQGAGSFVSAHEDEQLCKIGSLMGFCHDTADSGIFGSLLSEISHVCTLNNYSFVLTNYPAGDDEKILIRHAKRTCIELIKQQVDAVLFMPMDLSPENFHINHEIAVAIEDAGIVLVLLDRDIYKTPQRSKYDRVGANNELAAQVLTQHLIDQGCKKIDVVTCCKLPPSVEERIDGYQKAMIENGLNPKQEQFYKIDTHQWHSVEECLATTQADALLCINDEVAALIMRGLLAKGVKIPEETKIVGFDDLPISSYLPIPLTTVRQPVKDIAHEAFRTMITRREDPNMPAKDVLLTAQLIVRESCGASFKESRK